MKIRCYLNKNNKRKKIGKINNNKFYDFYKIEFFICYYFCLLFLNLIYLLINIILFINIDYIIIFH